METFAPVVLTMAVIASRARKELPSLKSYAAIRKKKKKIKSICVVSERKINLPYLD